MVEAASTVLIMLAVAWFIQYGLSFLQLKRFYKRIYQLRRFGSVWIGKEGSSWKGKQYAVLVVNKEKRIAKVEQLSGWTILANLKPVAGLEGRSIHDLMDDSIELPVSRKVLLALRNAVSFIYQAEEHAKKEKELEIAPSSSEIVAEMGSD